METIKKEELKEKLDRGEDFYLVDTMPEPYYRHSHLPGAVNLPEEEVGRAEELLPDKEAEVIVYCIDPPCPISERVGEKLLALGYENVKDYVGGKQDWVRAGYPAEGRHFERKESKKSQKERA